MVQILKLRAEEAHLLGFANYAELSLATKMANTPQQVLDFLHELAQCARPFAERDLAELREFARAQLGITELQAWDVSYASEHLRQQRYAFNSVMPSCARANSRSSARSRSAYGRARRASARRKSSTCCGVFAILVASDSSA